MADTPRTDAELLAELGPLAAVIADKVHSVPVRHCPGGTDDLITELTLAVAVYVGRHVLPAEALELRQPPRSPARQWQVETRWDDGRWRTYGAPYDDAAEAREGYDETLAHAAAANAYGRSRSFRLVRSTTTYAVEAQHTPETSC
ncbi:hypothetical protein ACH419_39430 [Streptomyces bobili]|uniref:hypothetical protein n=1 Tax=Streptomyces bobili TaxID=67280 RepID=UPI00378CB5D6